MAKYIIVGVILLVGAVVLGVSWFWTKKLLDKRKEGLNRRQDVITRREDNLDSRENQLDRREAEIAERERALEEKRKVLEEETVPKPEAAALVNRIELRPVQIEYKARVTEDEVAAIAGRGPIKFAGALDMAYREEFCREEKILIDRCLKAAQRYISVSMEDDARNPGEKVIKAELWVCSRLTEVKVHGV